MGEYAMALTNYYSNIDTYNMYAMYYGYGTYYDVKTEQGVQQLQEDMLSQLVSERVYIVLSLVAKSFLAWLVLFGAMQP